MAWHQPFLEQGFPLCVVLCGFSFLEFVFIETFIFYGR